MNFRIVIITHMDTIQKIRFLENFYLNMRGYGKVIIYIFICAYAYRKRNLISNTYQYHK